MYQVFRKGLTEAQSLDILYPFVHNPGSINAVSFGLVDLSKPNVVLAVLAGIAQYWVSKMLIGKKQPKVPGAKDEGMTAMMNKQMTFFMPLITVFIGLSLPGGLTLYWFVTTLLTGLQQLYFFKKRDKENGGSGDSKEIKINKHVSVIKKETS